MADGATLSYRTGNRDQTVLSVLHSAKPTVRQQNRSFPNLSPGHADDRPNTKPSRSRGGALGHIGRRILASTRYAPSEPHRGKKCNLLTAGGGALLRMKRTFPQLQEVYRPTAVRGFTNFPRLDKLQHLIRVSNSRRCPRPRAVSAEPVPAARVST